MRGVIGARAEEEMDRRSALVFSVPAVMLLLFLLDVSNKASLGDGNGKAEIMRVLRKLQAPQVSLGSMFGFAERTFMLGDCPDQFERGLPEQGRGDGSVLRRSLVPCSRSLLLAQKDRGQMATGE